ncbi:DUF58 domain-containing protein [Sphaerotilus microaerophilus]|uniref:DUF58 domain-containing protein n=1 Tax=Sphaerotilus microaerophilus TaxID=2914710 RepID=UPI0020742048|nr:DUF58 domain-containing protein [Sphaerotilus sp. FB-5]
MAVWPALRRRWQTWWDTRHPRSDRLLLTQRNVYILPTGAGWLFAVLLLTLLLASINYQLNLGYLLTFALAGIGLSSMHSTHANLRGLQLLAQAGEPVFVGEAASLRITLSEAAPSARSRWSVRRARRPRHGIGLRLSPSGTHSGFATRGSEGWTWADLSAGGEGRVLLAQVLPRRGWQGCGSVALETRFPFGLFRAWAVWHPAGRWLAWPAPEAPVPPLPWQAAHPGEQANVGNSPALAADEPLGLRAWRRGDPMSQVHWKRSAQALAGDGSLVSRETGGHPPDDLQLDWSALTGLDAERRLARLTAWVLAAEQAGVPYTLHLPGSRLEAGLGPGQRREALQRLACWGQPGETSP